MPNVESARKRMRTNEKRRQRNRADKAVLKTSLKRIGALVEAKDAQALQKAVVETLSVIGRTRRKGVINRRRAARLQSRIQRSVNQALAPVAPAAPVASVPPEKTV